MYQHSYLNTWMTTYVEIKLSRMTNPLVNHSSCSPSKAQDNPRSATAYRSISYIVLNNSVTPKPLTWKNVSTFVSHITPSMNLREKPRVMPFLDNHKRDWR
jgi:hypothetical protein